MSLPLLLILGVLLQAPAPAPAASVIVTRVAAPDKALRFEVTVPATVDEAWTAFTTADGLRTWLWRDARVDLRPGGDWLALYPGGKTGGGTIVSFESRRRIVIAAMAPEQFPAVRAERTRATFEFEPAGPAQTKVTLVQTGWKSGPEWDEAYEYLAKGNAILLTQLYKRFVDGPARWDGGGKTPK
jgi:uncharacterized protein YndB with AHSA1/START domain